MCLWVVSGELMCLNYWVDAASGVGGSCRSPSLGFGSSGTEFSAWADSPLFGDPRLPPRFWSKVQVLPNGCWLWQGAKSPTGYSHFRMKHGRVEYAHRVAYTSLVGTIPPALQIDHLCRVRHCVNPSHLETVSTSENTKRGNGGQNNRKKTEAPCGHPYTKALRTGGTGRVCQPCRLEYFRERNRLIRG